MKEPALEENALVAHVAEGRLTIERRSLDPAPPGEVTVTDPDGKTHKLALKPDGPGRSTAALPATTPGVWQVTDGRRTAYAAAGAANPLEIADLRATASVMGHLARQSDGGVHWLGSAAHPDIPGAAAYRAGPIGVRQFLDRPGAAARPPGDRRVGTGAAAALGGAAAAGRTDGAGLAARGALRAAPTERTASCRAQAPWALK